MPLSKAKLFDEYYQSIALTGRALAHPARVQIICLLDEFMYCSNIDLTVRLGLSKTTVNNHIKKLEEAGIVEVAYTEHCMRIELNASALVATQSFLYPLAKRST